MGRRVQQGISFVQDAIAAWTAGLPDADHQATLRLGGAVVSTAGSLVQVLEGEPRIEINQDHELYEGEVGSPMEVFWAEGHDHDDGDFLRAVVEHCLDHGYDIPRIADDAPLMQLWQQNIPQGDAIEYRRYDEKPRGVPVRDLIPVTVLDVNGRRAGATKCSVDGCKKPWKSGRPTRAKVDLDEGYMAITVWLCDEHGPKFPEPSYRVCFVPVGATIMLPEPT